MTPGENILDYVCDGVARRCLLFVLIRLGNRPSDLLCVYLCGICRFQAHLQWWSSMQSEFPVIPFPCDLAVNRNSALKLPLQWDASCPLRIWLIGLFCLFHQWALWYSATMSCSLRFFSDDKNLARNYHARLFYLCAPCFALNSFVIWGAVMQGIPTGTQAFRTGQCLS